MHPRRGKLYLLACPPLPTYLAWSKYVHTYDKEAKYFSWLLTNDADYEYLPQEQQECHNPVLDCCPVYTRHRHMHEVFPSIDRHDVLYHLREEVPDHQLHCLTSSSTEIIAVDGNLCVDTPHIYTHVNETCSPANTQSYTHTHTPSMHIVYTNAENYYAI